MNSTKQMLAVQSVVQELLPELQAKSGCERWGMNREALAEILCEVGVKSARPDTSVTELRTLFLNLHVEELVLARACVAGNNAAWELFLTRYREKLYLSALRIAREDSAARELSDSLYADLYGTTTRDGQRVSKLASYGGRGSLEGWLRTVLAQEYVNRYRRGKRLVSLDEESEEGVQFRAPDPEEVSSGNPHRDSVVLESATDEALAGLSREDRMVLSAYYLDERTLAEIARMLGVHESTISRKVDKLSKILRKQILAGMTRRGLARRRAEEALEMDVRDLQLDIRGSLTQEKATKAFSQKSEGARAAEGRDGA
jgi:RNA polymerase sigma-70 factor (ECF subfamily)